MNLRFSLAVKVLAKLQRRKRQSSQLLIITFNPCFVMHWSAIADEVDDSSFQRKALLVGIYKCLQLSRLDEGLDEL
jgi:hypothetical protein